MIILCRSTRNRSTVTSNRLVLNSRLWYYRVSFPWRIKTRELPWTLSVSACAANFFWLRRARRSVRNVRLKLDSSKDHTSRQNMTLLRGMFPTLLISRFGDIPWPSHSLELRVCDFSCRRISSLSARYSPPIHPRT
jgi:hypothetical protein